MDIMLEKNKIIIVQNLYASLLPFGPLKYAQYMLISHKTHVYTYIKIDHTCPITESKPVNAMIIEAMITIHPIKSK